MGKQSKTKSTQAAVTKDKDMECSRTTIENRLKEEAKYDDNKTEQLHSLVDGMMQDLNPYPYKHKDIIIDHDCLLPIECIDDVPIHLGMKLKVIHPRFCRMTIQEFHDPPSVPTYDANRVSFRLTTWIDSQHIFSHETENMKRYNEFPVVSKELKFESGKGLGIGLGSGLVEQLRCMTIICIIELLQVIPTLWFDKLTGKFQKGKQRKPVLDLFQFDNTKVKSYSECVVCYEMTETTTPCKHSLCYKCNENIKVVESTYQTFHRACPMCRENVLYEHSDEDE